MLLPPLLPGRSDVPFGRDSRQAAVPRPYSGAVTTLPLAAQYRSPQRAVLVHAVVLFGMVIVSVTLLSPRTSFSGSGSC